MKVNELAASREEYENYHLVNTGLEPGYYDPDTRMLHACFALLCLHVEEEMGGEEKMQTFTNELYAEPDPNAPEGWVSSQADRQTEALKLYRWWKSERPAEEKLIDEMTSHLFGRGFQQKDEPGGGRSLIIGGWWGDKEREMVEDLRTREEAFDAKEQEMLHRLIDIRRSLWI